LGQIYLPGNARDGERCWLCDGPSDSWWQQLELYDQFLDNPRYGAFLRSVPPSRRIGVYVQYASRAVNVMAKRLLTEYDNPRDSPVKDLYISLSQDAQCLPIAQRLSPCKNMPGTLDLTASRIFIEHLGAHVVDVNCEKDNGQNFSFREREDRFRSRSAIAVSSFYTLHRLWRQKTIFSDHDLSLYEASASTFGMIWCALGLING
jgi:hypothetical protein